MSDLKKAEAVVASLEQKRAACVAHALMWLVDAFHAILKLTVILWQFISDDVRRARNVPATGGSKKHSLTDLKLIDRHAAPHSTATQAIPVRVPLFLFQHHDAHANRNTPLDGRVGFI
jgi:hypothetical protein